jgi:hypothetical protein
MSLHNAPSPILAQAFFGLGLPFFNSRPAAGADRHQCPCPLRQISKACATESTPTSLPTSTWSNWKLNMFFGCRVTPGYRYTPFFGNKIPKLLLLGSTFNHICLKPKVWCVDVYFCARSCIYNVWTCIGVSELVFRIPELVCCVSELVCWESARVFVCLNLHDGCLNLHAGFCTCILVSGFPPCIAVL